MSELTVNLRESLKEEARRTLEHKLQDSITGCLKNDNSRDCANCVYDASSDCIASMLKDMLTYLNTYGKH